MRKKEIRLILSCCAVSVAAIMVAFTAFAATITVPGDYGSIQDAIINADTGDTVLCQPDTYTPVDFMGKAITVDCDGSPGSCIIDCDLEGPENYGAVFSTGEGSNSLLRGFTIRDCGYAAILCGSPINGDIAASVPSGPGSPTITNCTMISNNGNECSGGIDSYNSSPTLVNCDINHNVGNTAGGACFYGGSPTITGGSVSYNTSWGVGGIYNGQSPDSLTMTGVGVSYNSGHKVGGILCEDASPTLTGCTISYNSLFMGGSKSTSRGAAQIGGLHYTGGVAFMGGSPTITGGTVSFNTGWDVGGIFASDANIEIESSALNGGGLTLSGAVVTYNSGGHTGGIETWDASPTISDCNISYNWAWGCCSLYHTGGVALYGGSPTINGGNVSFNSAEGVGGIYCEDSVASPTLSGVTVNDNSAEQVGGIAFAESAGTVTDCTITGNSGNPIFEGGAGGVAVYGPELEPVSIAAAAVGDVEITRSYITGNTGESGGFYANMTSPTLTNCIISGNMGVHAGIGLENLASPTIMNCTIADNDGNGEGGIGQWGDNSATVTNSILWGNTTGDQIEATLAATVTYSDVQGGHAGTGNINADPVFIGGGDYHLTPGSPCLDVATADGAPADDIDGDVRPQGAGYDMGADEHLPDDDGDGVPSLYEMGPDGDPGYDGNDDGVPDWTQPNVSSFPTVDGGNYVTIECPDPSFFVNVAAAPNPSPSNTPPVLQP